MKTLSKISFMAMLLLNCISTKAQITATLNVARDAHYITWGGGSGGNSNLKFDITPIPSGATITSVSLQVYVKSKQANWDGDVKFFNINNQAWVETTLATVMKSYPKSDSTHQSSGFATSLGWSSSVNLSNIFLTDYIASNQFCTIYMKDPDDMTNVATAVSMTNVDTLACGNPAMNQSIGFASKEYTNAALRPKLVVNYISSSGMANFNYPSTGICVGSPVTFTDVTTNSPTSWSWNMPSATPNVSSVQNPTVIYSASGVYNVTLTTVTSSGTSSVVKTFTVFPTPTISVVGPSTICSGNSATLTANGAATYTWNPGSLSGASAVVTPTATTIYTVTGVTSAGCNSSTTKTLSVTVCSGINEIANNTNFDLNVYPNPAKDLVTITWSSKQSLYNSSLQIQIFDMTGKQIIYPITSNETNTIHLDKLSKGIYFIRLVKDNESLKTAKLLIE